MRALPLGWLTIAAWCLAGAGGIASDTAAAAEPIETIEGVGISRGIARLICIERESGGSIRTRAIILDVGNSQPARDVLLAPAHGIPVDPDRIRQDCSVVGAGGSQLPIVELWLSGDRHELYAGDWVVLTVGAAVSGDVHRMKFAMLAQSALRDLAVDEAPVALMLYSPSVDQHCRILDEGLGDRRQMTAGLFIHSCRSWRGVSGAPIVIGVDGEPVVIGIHIAHFEHVRGRGNELARGIGRIIDADIEAAINAAAARARELPPDENLRRRRDR